MDEPKQPSSQVCSCGRRIAAVAGEIASVREQNTVNQKGTMRERERWPCPVSTVSDYSFLGLLVSMQEIDVQCQRNLRSRKDEIVEPLLYTQTTALRVAIDDNPQTTCRSFRPWDGASLIP